MADESGRTRGLLSVVYGNTPEMRGRALELLLRAAPRAIVLSVSLPADGGDGHGGSGGDGGRRARGGGGGRPAVQRFTSGGDTHEPWARGATGIPSVILRQDLLELSRTARAPHVILSLPEHIDVTPFLADVWRPPLGSTPLASRYELAPVVAALDPDRFLADLRCVHQAVRVWGDAERPAPLTLAEAAARQAEGAGVLIIGSGPPETAGRHAGVRALLGHMNPSAAVLADGVDAAELAAAVVPGGRGPAADPADRLDPLSGSGVCRRGVHHGVSSVLWRARRPMHPQRLAEALHRVLPGVVRGRGHLWLAGRPDTIVSWRSAGGHVELAEAGRWLARDDAEAWRRASPERRTLAAWFWDDYYEERRNEIVFTGGGLDPDRVRAELDAALLDDGELALGAAEWARFPDPLFGTRPGA
ncbi:GTP-binding protein [Streptomyces sp. XD-27]|uniref:GTP-binding protein n=1 Tax=Streptomyces sp. XD-27 TaxID=3062779 RepID=UPI0026F45123|nr:GTP-binding protein [Streptomyces sp. XD-27]WKX68814.1 GTP-binding protein [Streptomyces sp. XD-27]